MDGLGCASFVEQIVAALLVDVANIHHIANQDGYLCTFPIDLI